MGAKRNGRLVAENRMTACEMEPVESCRSLRIVPDDLFRPANVCAELVYTCLGRHFLKVPRGEGRAACRRH